MGFYGNITNTSRTQFRFERVYANRYLMDNSAATDGVYMGNYVLVDYDTELQADWCITAYAYTPDPSNVNNIEFYTGPKEDGSATRITYSQCRLSKNIQSTAYQDGYYTKYILVPANKTVSGSTVVYNHIGGSYLTPSINPGSDKDVLFKVTGYTGGTDWTSSAAYPLVEVVSRDNTEYGKNLLIDQNYYDTARGYDSTVWQKVYTGSPATAHYVMLAELNTVVPTFTVSADAPTMSPLAPHFDTGSTNVVYNLHTQPSWGLRVKSAANTLVAETITPGTGMSYGDLIQMNYDTITGNKVLSDESTTWYLPYYNSQTNALEQYTYIWKDSSNNGTKIKGNWSLAPAMNYTSDIPAAIYYNKAGFNPSIISYSPDMEDSIQITPTGLSGQKYNAHTFNYVEVGTFADASLFATAQEALHDEVAGLWPNDQSINTQSGFTYDIYKRDYFYTRKNGVYFLANNYSDDETIYYKKKTLPLYGDKVPQVDTQEISIALPSIGNSIAKLWDVMYGDAKLNNGIRRNQSIKWLEGRVFHKDNGLRLVRLDANGFGYVPVAANTVAGAINSMHDALGMLIKDRTKYEPYGQYEVDSTNFDELQPYIFQDGGYVQAKQFEQDTTYYERIDRSVSDETQETINSLSSSYIYYYPGDGLFYRRGITYKWGDTDYTEYSAYTRQIIDEETGEFEMVPTKELEPFLTPISSDDLKGWPSPNTQYYYREMALENPEGTSLYNYIIEQDYYHGRDYYTIHDYPEEGDLVPIGDAGFNEFQIGTYYEWEPRRPLTYTRQYVDDNQQLKIEETTVKIPTYVISSDEEYNPEHEYYTILSTTPVGENYRLFEYVENDITRQFFIATRWEERQITEDEYNEAPTKYYIASGNTYERSNGFNPNETYYTPREFSAATEFDPAIEHYYKIELKTTKQDEIYVSQIAYEPYGEGIITETTFERYICYVKDNSAYTVATEFADDVTYYKRIQKWILSQLPQGISAENATQVRCIDPTEMLVEGRPVYYFYDALGPSGFPEYYGVTTTMVNGYVTLNYNLDLPIVQLSYTKNIGFYAPYTMYYQAEDGPFKGSWFLDTNSKATENRQYYYPLEQSDTTECDYDFYEGLVYATETGELNTSMTHDAEGQYYRSSPLYIYDIAVDSPAKDQFEIGDKWNMDIDLPANSGLTLRQLIETPTMIPLNGFARSSQTMNGSILAIDEVLSNRDYYTRSRKTIAGALNSINDIINVFGDIDANAPVLSNKYGHLYTRGMIFNNVGDANVIGHSAADAADPWVHITEDRSTDQENWHLQVHHKLLNDANGTLQSISNTDLVINAAENAQAQAPNFGATFNILNRVKKDAAGHIHSIVTDTVQIPLPSLTEDATLNTSNDYQVLMDVALNAPLGAFTYRRHNVADLKLHDYSNTTAANYPASGHIIVATQTINEAFAALETYIGNSDLATQFADTTATNNEYITNLTQTDGRISYSVTSLLNTNATITTTANGAVSGKGVRDVINALDVSTQFTGHDHEDNYYITELTETDGKIAYSLTQLLNTNTAITSNAYGAVSGVGVRAVIDALDSSQSVEDTVAAAAYMTGITEENGLLTGYTQSTFITSVTNETTSIIAPTGAAVATYVNGLFTNTAYSNKASTSKWITSLSQTYGEIDYEVTDLLTSVNDIYGANAGYAATGTAIRNGIDDVFLALPSLEAGNFLTGLVYENASNEVQHKRLKGVSTAFVTTFAGNTASSIAPTTKAVYDYLANTYAGTSNINTVGTIGTGTWQGTTIGVLYGGTGVTSIADIQAGKDGNGDTISSTYYKNTGGFIDGSIHLRRASDSNNPTQISFREDSTETRATIQYMWLSYNTADKGALAFSQNSYNSSDNSSLAYTESYYLPTATPDRVASISYDILTSKNVVTVAQGGTGVATVAPNLVFAGPVNPMMADAAPTWRILEAYDIPSLPANKITSGIFEMDQWLTASFGSIPHTVTANDVTTTTYTAFEDNFESAYMGTTSATQTLDQDATPLDIMRELYIRTKEMYDWINEFITNNPTLTIPNSTSYPLTDLIMQSYQAANQPPTGI